MDGKQHKRISKFLSLVLRHDPAAAGVALDEAGWVAVDDLLRGCAAVGLPVTREELDEVVCDSSKQRFALSPDGTRIRANQGHSVEVDLGLEAAEPPDTLFHGTVEAVLPAIREAGLRKMARHHVHLSADLETATSVGGRRGRAVVLRVDARAMREAGYAFYRSANGVWLVDEVPPRFLVEP